MFLVLGYIEREMRKRKRAASGQIGQGFDNITSGWRCDDSDVVRCRVRLDWEFMLFAIWGSENGVIAKCPRQIHGCAPFELTSIRK